MKSSSEGGKFEGSQTRRSSLKLPPEPGFSTIALKKLMAYYSSDDGMDKTLAEATAASAPVPLAAARVDAPRFLTLGWLHVSLQTGQPEVRIQGQQEKQVACQI